MNSGRILVVDDDPSHLMLMQVNLTQWGHEVMLAHTVTEASELATTREFELVICDQRMPPNGDSAATDLLRALRAGGVDTEFVVLTAHATIQSAVETLRAGAYDYLTKGDEWDKVRALVDRALRHRANRLALRRGQEQAEQLKRDLMAMIIHDLKTPISTLKMAVWTLAAGRMGPLNQAQKEISELARGETERLATRVDDLLSLFRMESGEIKLSPRATDLNGLVQDAVAQIQPLAEKNQHTVNFTPGGRLPYLDLDPEFIARVMMNLLDNAIKFSLPGETIRVTTSLHENLVRVEIADTGEGISPEYQELIFEKFRQAPRPDSAPRFGSGLGLAFCKIAIEAHGGAIGVTSETKRGSTFFFTLPVPPGKG